MRNAALGFIGAVIVSATLLGSLRADIIHLKAGKVEGVILKKTETELVVQTAAGKVTLNPADVVSIEQKSSPLDLYRTMAPKAGEKGADGHYALGLWCTDQKLFGEARKQFEKAIAVDPEHKGAREKLGYMQKEGKWVTRAQAKEAEGFVKHEGAWVTPEQRDAAVQREAVLGWLRRLRAAVARGPMASDAVAGRLAAVLGEKAGQPGEMALRGLLAEMTKAAQDARRDRESEARIALIDLIAQQKQPEAADLIRRTAIADPNDNVRAVAVKTLGKQKNVDDAGYFVGLLREFTGQRYRITGDRKARGLARRVLRRAAEALGELGDPRAVPALAEAMFVRFHFPEKADELPPMTIGFNRTTFGPSSVVTDSQGNQYVTPVTSGTNWGLGQGDPEKDTEEALFFNEAAYAALRRLTSQDFSHDRRAWLAWWYRNRYNYED